LVDLLFVDLDSKSLTSSLKRIGTTVIGLGEVVAMQTPVHPIDAAFASGVSRGISFCLGFQDFPKQQQVVVSHSIKHNLRYIPLRGPL
jgi:hypothetical protein